MAKRSLGICIGASTVKLVHCKKLNGQIETVSTEAFVHEGSPGEVLKRYFAENDLSDRSIVVTGRKFKELLNTTSIPEPLAIETAVKHNGLAGSYGCVASLGAETFLVYTLKDNGSIDNVYTGNKCASGTGEFFLQQIGRMNLTLEEALKEAHEQKPHTVSGRCSVFCKSDCTHALNKGVPIGQVVAGLGKMIAEKTLELLAKQKSEDVLLIGGVSNNKNVTEYIKQEYSGAIIPDEADYFEALGAAVYAIENDNYPDLDDLFKNKSSSFSYLEPLQSAKGKVTFKDIKRDTPNSGDECILGLDIGSTTTKAVIIRKSDNALLASVYLRTNGNPVQASVNCYKSLKEQIDTDIKITGLGTTGSGRHISALHALTKGVINEIIAHAVAAAHFDDTVDTIFEIGGQDAKYTYLTNGIASDYAMNEACSAGTGSFLEEAAKETLNIKYTEIADIAIDAESPINFNDQCAAFISSDIKNASHAGNSKEDIVAGLVYSICMNYVNRVKGSRPVGHKVFMQGGVCYNYAVPHAMANLIGKEIIIPPEPGLMGAFGVALEIKNRIDLGLLEKDEFILDELINREFRHVKDFVCMGGAEKCDRKCSISMIEVEGKKYPFGGACNKYYNQLYNIELSKEEKDYVKMRQHLVFNKYASLKPGTGKTIGIIRSFLTNTLYPLYYNYFTKLGFKVVLSEDIKPEGIDKAATAFCYPAEITHGMFQDLVDKKPDYVFIPHINNMHNPDGSEYNRICVFVQGEAYYLKTTFQDEDIPELLISVLDFSKGPDELEKTFTELGKQLGVKKRDSAEAYRFASGEMKKMYREFRELGREALARLEQSSDKFGVVLFGRSYNAFTTDANLNIPHKFSSKDIMIIPHDFLDSESYYSYENMYWFSGNQILRSARMVKENDNLFGVFITNFSCGPDSFIVPYFRKIMGTKPSLTLELDSHSADVGVDTRIDAAIDIIKNYLELKEQGVLNEKPEERRLLDFTYENEEYFIIDADGNKSKVNSNNVKVVVPSMGKYSADAFSAVFTSLGIDSSPMPVPTPETMNHGKSLTSCKECLPFILTAGSLIEYLKTNDTSDKNVLFFMPHGYGPCRQGQYWIRIKDIIQELKLENVGVISLNDENSFRELGEDFFRRAWVGILVADMIADVHSALYTLAEDRVSAMAVMESEWRKINDKIKSGDEDALFDQLDKSGSRLAEIPLKQKLEDAKIISLIGEIYVRREEFSRMDLIDILADNGFVVKTAPISEYVYHCNYLQKIGVAGDKLNVAGKLKLYLKDKFQEKLERRARRALAKSGLLLNEMIEVEKTHHHAGDLLSEYLLGESILTLGLALREILDETCGVISIGPFNCMPSRIAEAILNKEMTLEGKYRSNGGRRNGYPEDINSLPFLYVETDGNSFPQITQSRIEIFMMQANKLYEKMKAKRLAD